MTKLSKNQKIAVATFLVAVIALAIAAGTLYFQAHPTPTPPPPLVRSIEVVPSFMGGVNLVLGPNGSVKDLGSPTVGYVFANYSTLMYVTVTDTGDTPIYLTSILLTTNITRLGFSTYAIPATEAPLAPDASFSYPIQLVSEDWPLMWVRCTFEVTGNNVTGSAVMNIGVFEFPNSNST